MRLAIEVMHVPGVYSERDACVQRIYEGFRKHTVTVHCDRVGAGPWHTMRRCLTHGIASGADLIMVLQDDIAWPVGLDDWVVRELAPLPDNCAAQLYSGVWRSAALGRLAEERGWLRTHSCPGGLATVLTRAGAKSFVSWANRCYRPEYHHSDERLAWWLICGKGELYVPLPCLVQHMAPTHTESLLGHTKSGRSESRYYIGDEPLGPWPSLGCGLKYKCDGVRSYDFDTRAWTLLGKLELIQEGTITQEFWDVQEARRPKTLDAHHRPLQRLRDRLKGSP